MRIPSKRNIVILSGFLCLLLIPNLLVRIIPSKARLSLPRSATEIQEKYYGCVFYDYFRILKAKVSEEDYRLFIKNYGSLIKYDPTVHDDLILVRINRSLCDAPSWWTDQHVDDGYFISGSNDYFVSVKFIDGYLFYFESRT